MDMEFLSIEKWIETRAAVKAVLYIMCTTISSFDIDKKFVFVGSFPCFCVFCENL